MALSQQCKNTQDVREVIRNTDAFSAGRIIARAVAQSVPAEQRVCTAQTFCYQLVEAWWQAVAANCGNHPLRSLLAAFDAAQLPEPLADAAGSIGRSASTLAPEQAAYAIGLTYTAMLPDTYRAQFGVYYTPPALAARLIHQATAAGVDWATCRVLDPACGGGAFLAPVAKQILSALANMPPALLIKNIGNRLRGYEIDPFAAWLSQVTLDALLLPACQQAGIKLPLAVTVCDSLLQPIPRERFDLVIGNPPYGRLTLPAEDRTRFKRSLFGHANLYGLFTDQALRQAKTGGVIAFVTPTSFLAGEYFKNLRALLGRSAPPATIDFVAARKGVFEDVLQETLLATYRRGAAAAPVDVHQISLLGEGTLTAQTVGKVRLPADPSEPWLLPRDADQAPLVAQLATTTHRLADWGYAVSTGPLVWNRHKKQLVERAGRKRHPLIWAEAVTADGRFVWRAEKKNHCPYFEAKPGDDWLIVDTPCVLLQRTTAKEQARRLIAAALPAEFIDTHGGVVIENHLNMLRPLHERPAVSADLLAAFLNSGAADRAFRCVSGSVAVSAYELEALPLPAPEELEELRRLVSQQAERNQLEAACDQLYKKDA